MSQLMPKDPNRGVRSGLPRLAADRLLHVVGHCGHWDHNNSSQSFVQL
jgi:hypothetical protein